MRPLILVGASGLAREVIAGLAGSRIIDSSDDHKVIGLLDDRASLHGSEMSGVPVLGPVDSAVVYDDARFLVCVGSGQARSMIVDRLARSGIRDDRYATVLDRQMSTESSSIGPGSILLAGVTLTAGVTVGAHVVMMPRVVCTHDDRIASFVTLCAGVVLGGGASVGTRSYIGMNASVREGVRIHRDSVLGMGAALLQDLPAGGVWAGVPARAINRRGRTR
jgi:sugar O-acyltransferase (sialic acid O-acetyltransferase NeuD family)